MAFSSVHEMIDLCKESGKPLYEVILESDLAESGLTRAESEAEMHRLWAVMRATSDGYCGADRSMSGFAGGDAAKVNAAAARGVLYADGYFADVIAEALKTAECNACMKRIVAAPTAGSCGVLPAVLFTMWASANVKSTYNKYSRQQNSRGMTGAQAARRVLDANGLQNVAIQQIEGELTDHYDPKAELEHIHAKVDYVGETWLERAKEDFRKASEQLGKPAPEVRGLSVGQSAVVGEITVTALPANHATGDDNELTLMFLVEKGPVRVLYATDTGGIPARAARIAGIDAHIPEGRPITGLVMEATMGIDFDEDFRIFTHSSVGTVLRTSDVLLSTGRLKAPKGQPVYLTHMARTLHGTQAELDAQLPSPLRAAFDGLEAIFRID